MSGSNRKFSEEQVSQLLKLAIKRQEDDREATFDHNHGLTLEEVQRIAAEAGIDEKYVRFALMDLDGPEREEFKRGFWGAPMKVELEADIQGKLDDETILEISGLIRKHYKKGLGHLETFRNSFDWRNSASAGSTLFISAQPHGDVTRFTITQKMDEIFVLFHLWWLMFGPIGIMGTLVKQNIPAFLWIAGIVGALILIGRFGMWKIFKKREDNLRELLAEIVDVAEQGVSSGNDWSYSDTKSPSTSKSKDRKIDLEDASGYELGNAKETSSSSKKTKS